MSLVLVIGSTGNIGQPLVRELLARGVSVRALVRDLAKARSLLGSSLEFVQGDVADPSTLATALDGVDALFLLTNASPEMVAQQVGVIRAAKAAGVRKIVKLSAIGASADSPVQLGRWHAAIETELVASGVTWVSLQPGFFMQNFLGDAAVRATKTLYAPVGHGRVSTIDAADIAAVAAVALTTDRYDRQVIPVLGREALSYSEIAAAIGAGIGAPVQFVDVPPAAAEAGMRQAGLPDWFVADMLTLLSFIPAGYMSGTSDVVEAATGRPARTFAAFAKDNAGAWA